MPPDLSYVWDWARLFVVLGGGAVGVFGISLALRRMPNIPPRVEAARSTLIIGLVLLIGAAITARVQHFQEPPSPQLVISVVAVLVLLLWVVRERHALRGSP